MAAKVVELLPGIYRICLPLPVRPTIINVYLVDCHGAWALIDTGVNSKESLAALEDALAQVGVRIEDLGVLIGTHHHIDHLGASGEIRRRSHATTCLHQLEAERASLMLSLGRLAPGDWSRAGAFFVHHGFPVEQYPAGGMRPAWMGTELYRPITEPDRPLRDGDVIEVGDRKLEVIWTPGHTPGHCVLYLRKEKVLIAGDHLLPKITPHVGIYPGTLGDPLGDFLNSQRKVQCYDAEHVLPAHGGIYYDHRRRAAQLIEHHRRREAEMLEVTSGKPLTAFEVAGRIFGNEERPIFHLMAATFETLAHLEHARLEGRARKTERSGRIVFQAV